MTSMNLWHDLKPGTSESMTVIVEIPKGSKNKYEIDKETGLIALDRVMHSAQDYPFDYGFVPQTLWDDGDPLDVVLLTTYPLAPGILVRARPVAIIDMNDSGDGDAKIIAVPEEDPRWNNVKDKSDVNPHTFQEIDHFFTTYKKLQNKEVVIHGVGDAKTAREAFDKAVAMYKDKYKSEA